MKQTIALFSITLLFFEVASAQYLEVRRSATVKEQPFRDSPIIEKVEKGTYLELLDNGQQENGYYKVKAQSDNQAGWIYRTLVRRYEGSISGSIIFTLAYEEVPADYYSGIEESEGEELKLALHEIIREHREYSYGDVWDILKETDIDTQNTSRVIGIYSEFSMDADAEYNGGKGWNREHVWAKSYGDFGTTMGAGTDVHHLRAEDVSTNSARNNRSFDESDIPYTDKSGNYKGPTHSFTSTTAWIWEPRDEIKGDVARMMFYMVVRYEGDNGEPDLELVDSIVNRDNKLPLHGRLSTLLKWHEEDPVDNYERYRNSIIYKKYQHNRNPFIDHPEFVRKIWGEEF
jgi:endonuclease I